MSSARPDILCVGAVLWDVIGRSPVPMAPTAPSTATDCPRAASAGVKWGN